VALSNRFKHIEGAYTDCFSLQVSRPVSLQQFVFAFYTSRVFRLERLILRHLIKMPSTDLQAKEIASGAIQRFAAWTVEDRSESQLLMCDFQNITRSWFMVEPADSGERKNTRLYFGSVIVPVKNKKTGEFRLGTVYRILLGFHRLYSRVLLRSAHSRLRKLTTAERA